MARGATIGIVYYIFFNTQNNLPVKTYYYGLITCCYVYNTFSGITSIGRQHIQQHITIQRKLATTIQHRDRDILNLQATEDLVQDKAEL